MKGSIAKRLADRKRRMRRRLQRTNPWKYQRAALNTPPALFHDHFFEGSFKTVICQYEGVVGPGGATIECGLRY